VVLERRKKKFILVGIKLGFSSQAEGRTKRWKGFFPHKGTLELISWGEKRGRPKKITQSPA